MFLDQMVEDGLGIVELPVMGWVYISLWRYLVRGIVGNIHITSEGIRLLLTPRDLMERAVD